MSWWKTKNSHAIKLSLLSAPQVADNWFIIRSNYFQPSNNHKLHTIIKDIRGPLPFQSFYKVKLQLRFEVCERPPAPASTRLDTGSLWLWKKAATAVIHITHFTLQISKETIMLDLTPKRCTQNQHNQSRRNNVQALNVRHRNKSINHVRSSHHAIMKQPKKLKNHKKTRYATRFKTPTQTQNYLCMNSISFMGKGRHLRK